MDKIIKKFIFIHIPRTAGTSIARALKDHIWTFPRRPAKIEKWLKIIDNENSLTLEHTNIHKLIEGGAITEDFYNDSFKFTFVRNPWDRVLSLYKNMMSSSSGIFNINKSMGYCLICGGGFKSFVHHLAGEELDEVGLYNRKGWSQFNSQLDWIPDDIDFVGKFENLEEDFEYVCDQIGHERVKLPHENKITVPPSQQCEKKAYLGSYRDLYDEETKGIVQEMYEEEIERFEYEF